MKRILIYSFVAAIFFLISPFGVFSNTQLKSQYSSTFSTDYTVRVNIDGKWYLVTYNSDGYIINMIEDDE